MHYPYLRKNDVMRFRLAVTAFLFVTIALGACGSKEPEPTSGVESTSAPVEEATTVETVQSSDTPVDVEDSDTGNATAQEAIDAGSPNNPARVLSDCPASLIMEEPDGVRIEDTRILQCVNGIATIATSPEGGDGVVDYFERASDKWTSIGQAVEGNDPPELPADFRSRLNPMMESDGSPDSCTVLTELYGNCTDYRAVVSLDEFQLPTDDGATASAGISIVTGSANWRVVFTEISVQACAQCFGGVGGAAYEKVDGTWVLREKAPLIARVGISGSVGQPEIAWNSGANSLMLYASADGENDYSIATLTGVGFNGTFYRGFEEPVQKLEGDCESENPCTEYNATIDLIDDAAKVRPSAPTVVFHRSGVVEGAPVDDYVVYDLAESGREFTSTTGTNPGR